MRKNLLALVALAAIAWACSADDNAVTPGTRTLTFTVPNIEVSEEEVWIVLSAADGTVLNTDQLQAGVAYTYQAPDDFQDAALTVTLVRTWINNDGQYTNSEILSYTHVPFGEYETRVEGDPFPEGPPAKGATSLLVKGLFWEESLNIMMNCPSSSMLSGSSVNEGETEIGMSYYVKPSADKTAILLTGETAPFQYLYVEVEPGKDYTRSVADFQEPILRTIEIPQNTEIFSHEIVGWNDYGRFRYSALSQNVQGATWPVPKIPVFTSYETRLTATWDNGYDTYEITGNDVPGAMKRIDGPFDYNIDAEAGSLSWKTGNDVDVVELYAAEYSGYSTTWLAVGPGGDQAIMLPTIPDSVSMQRNATRTFAALTGESLEAVALTAYPEFDSYEEALVKPYLAPGNTVLPKERIMRAYLGGNHGGRKTGHFLPSMADRKSLKSR